MYGAPRPAILLSTEDDPEIDLGPRIEAAGGDRSLVAMPPASFQLPRDIDWLREYVSRSTSRGAATPGSSPSTRSPTTPGKRTPTVRAEVRTALMPLAVLVTSPHPDYGRAPPIHQGGEGRRARQGARLDSMDRSSAGRARRRFRLGRRSNRPTSAIKGNRCPAGRAGRRFRLEGRMLPGFTESVVYAVEDGVSDIDVDAELSRSEERVDERPGARAADRHVARSRRADGVRPARRRCRCCHGIEGDARCGTCASS